MGSKLPECCGTCRSIRYRGPQELYQEAGTCAKSKDSGRVYVRFDMEPCPLWSLRPKRVRDLDKAKQAAMGKIVDATNKNAHKRRRSND